VALPTKVSVDVGNVIVPVFVMLEITGVVSVLLVSVSVVARPTKVSVEVGKVSVPVLVILEITGVVKVLLVRVSVVALPTRVSVATGKVNTDVPAVAPERTVVVPEVEPENLTPVLPKVGRVAKTKEPEPVSSVTAVARLALDGVARKVATPVPRPDTPVDTGSPVALVRVTEVGVPRTGVTRVGLVANTKEPVPVSSEMTPAN
jgi:hypothetical protein